MREYRADMGEEQYLYLTTTGRKTGLPREIEIWFVEAEGKYYILAEHRHKAQWVKNIQTNPRVRVRVGAREFAATARVLDAERDRDAFRRAQALEKEKYGWGTGLPVEIVADRIRDSD
ncbi:MAG: nitroreductase family deazaflavin-dependent oxidoreductase [Chloroflexi bacterium]|nr:nitroreductase family deazaflavin-dependent oxidoreductase [Chloroflexota bacterium]